ncbi:hypothetical protein [Nocardioides pacificus]
MAHPCVSAPSAVSVLVLVLAGSVSGCAGTIAAADCADAVLYDGVVYIETGAPPAQVETPTPELSSEDAARFDRSRELGVGDQAACDDTGRDPIGIHFPDDAAKLVVWSLPGYDSAHVVTVPQSGSESGPEGGSGEHVFVAEDIPEAVRRDLERSGLVNDSLSR